MRPANDQYAILVRYWVLRGRVWLVLAADIEHGRTIIWMNSCNSDSIMEPSIAV